MKIKQIRLGSMVLENNVLMAPLTGFTNYPFRMLCYEMGAGLCYTEMVSCNALKYKDRATKKLLLTTKNEKIRAGQILDADPNVVEKIVKGEYFENFDIIDINMGCPVPKVAIRSQAGSALLKNPEKIKEIVEAVVKSVPIPITVKIRSGWDNNSINAVEIAKICESAGASAICIHPRTRMQGYSGHSDWSIIKEVKRNVSIPVIGNGDIKSIYDAKKMIEETNCDAIMIGRGVLGNPWLIKEIDQYLNNNIIIQKPTKTEKIEMCIKHLEYLLKIKPEKVAVLEIRNHIAWYLKGLKDSNIIKNKIYITNCKNDIINILNNYKKGDEYEKERI